MNSSTENKGNAANIPVLLFARTSMFTLSCALAAFTVFATFRTLVTAFSAYPLNELKSLYYFFGESVLAIGLVNGICGGIVCAVLFLLSLGMFKTISAAKTQNHKKFLNAADFVKYSLVAGIILTVVMIVCSMASVSIINYEYTKNAGKNLYYQSYRSSAGSLFALTILFGAISLTLEIALMRLLLAIQRTVRNDIPQKQGSVLAIITGSFGAVATTITFVTTLFELVMPGTVNSVLSPAMLANNTLNVLLSAAVSVLMIAAIVVVSVYICMTEDLQKGKSAKIYQDLFSNTPPSPYKSYATEQNYDYHQPTNYPPYYDVNRAYNKVFQNIYENKVPPVPEKPVLSFKLDMEIPHTQYPAQAPVSLEKSTDSVKESEDN